MDEPARALEIANRAIGLRPRRSRATSDCESGSSQNEELFIGDRGRRRGCSSCTDGRGHARQSSRRAGEQWSWGPEPVRSLASAPFAPRGSSMRRTQCGWHRRAPPAILRPGLSRRPLEGGGSRSRTIDGCWRSIPQHAAAMNNIALIEFHRGRLGAGGSGFARAIRADPTLRLARGNAIVVVRQTALLFQGLWWLLYCSFSGIAASPASGAFAFAWTTRGEVALLLCAALGVLAVVAFGRMDPAVRSLARRVVARSWLVKILVVADFMTLVCFLMANLGRGVLSRRGMALASSGFSSRSSRTASRAGRCASSTRG